MNMNKLNRFLRIRVDKGNKNIDILGLTDAGKKCSQTFIWATLKSIFDKHDEARRAKTSHYDVYVSMDKNLLLWVAIDFTDPNLTYFCQDSDAANRQGFRGGLSDHIDDLRDRCASEGDHYARQLVLNYLFKGEEPCDLHPKSK